MIANCLELLDSLKLDRSDVDLLLVGDGSGTTHEKPCGWACVCFEPKTEEFRLERGGSSSGTNNLAELTPYVHCLWNYQVRLEKEEPLYRVCKKVVIVSDSEWVVKCALGLYSKNALLHLWEGLKVQKKITWVRWFHRPRMSNPMLRWADAEAGKIRKMFVELSNG